MHFNRKILRTVALIPGTYYRGVHIIEEYGLCNGLIDSPPLVVSMVLCAIRRGFLFGLILEVDMTTTLLQYNLLDCNGSRSQGFPLQQYSQMKVRVI